MFLCSSHEAPISPLNAAQRLPEDHWTCRQRWRRPLGPESRVGRVGRGGEHTAAILVLAAVAARALVLSAVLNMVAMLWKGVVVRETPAAMEVRGERWVGDGCWC